MKISPVPSAGNSVDAMAPAAPQSMTQKIRSLRMTTNATPGYEPELAIPDTVDPATAAIEETKPLSPQLAAIAKQRRALQLEKQALERERAALKQSPTQGAGVDVARLKSDPLGVLLEAGVTYQQLTDAVLANDSGSPTREMEAKLKALEESLDKKFTDRDQRDRQQVLAEMGREAKQIIAEGDDFELVRERKAIPKALQLVEAIYDRDGDVIDIREALRLVEEELFKEIEPLAKLNKVQRAFAPAPAPTPPQQHRQQMRTLTNRDTASVPLSPKARAIAAFHGTLKR